MGIQNYVAEVSVLEKVLPSMKLEAIVEDNVFIRIHVLTDPVIGLCIEVTEEFQGDGGAPLCQFRIYRRIAV